MRYFLASLIVAATALGAGCGPDDPSGVAIATVDGRAITAAELTVALLEIPKPDQLEYLTDDGKRVLVDLLIDRQLAANEAVRLGLGPDENSANAESGARDRESELLLEAIYLGYRVEQAVPPDEAALVAYFAANRQSFETPERVKVERVVFASPERAEIARVDLSDSVGFSEYKSRYPAEKIRVDSRWLQQRDNAAGFETIAFGLRPDEISEVIELKTGHGLLRVVERHARSEPSLDEARPRVTAMLRQQREREMLTSIRAELRDGVDITVNEAALEHYSCMTCVE